MALSSIDPRIIELDIIVSGRTKIYTAQGYEPLNITATGTKFANALQNEATITISNLDKATQDYIMSETTPFNLNTSAKTVTLKAGRQSYGTAVIYSGNIVSSSLSQPPDIGITLKCLTGNFLKNNVYASQASGSAKQSQVFAQIAQQQGLVLQNESTDKNISNYNFTGSGIDQVRLINSFGGINAFVDGNTLVIKDALIPLRGTTRILNADSGLIGIPEFTEQGLRATYLLDNKTVIGGGLQISSNIYPSINGHYVIYKLGFNITSRDIPFYYIAEGARIGS